MSAPTLEQPVARKDIVIKQGDDFLWNMLVFYKDGSGDIVPVDTAGWNIRLQVRNNPDLGTSPLLTASVSGGYITRGIEGTAPDQTNIRIKIPWSVTLALDEDTWTSNAGYDLIVIYTNGDRSTIVSGKACLEPAYAGWS